MISARRFLALMTQLTSNPLVAFERQFEVWGYWVSHSQMLLRSNKTDDAATRIDVFFANVAAFDLPTVFQGLTISEVSWRKAASLGVQLGSHTMTAQKLFAIRGADFSGYVVASAVAWHEDRGTPSSPSYFEGNFSGTFWHSKNLGRPLGWVTTAASPRVQDTTRGTNRPREANDFDERATARISTPLVSFERRFQVWGYRLDHSRMLLRSGKSHNEATRVDVLFEGVTRFKLPTFFQGLTISEMSWREAPSLGAQLGLRATAATKLFAIRGTNFSGYIAASAVAWHEDSGDHFSPSYFEASCSLAYRPPWLDLRLALRLAASDPSPTL